MMRPFWIGGLAMALAAACGGSTDGDGTGGAAGAGGSSASGGSSGSAGSSATGGSSGSSATGGSSGSSATGGSSGTGGGTAGAGGSGAQSNWDSCEYPGDCMLFAKNCCGGYCGEVPITEFIPINSAMSGEVQDALCSTGVACPDCITHPNPNYVAPCRAGKCVSVDIRTDDLSACNTSADCQLRWGSDCCESCASNINELIAVSKNANLGTELCSPFAGACPPCAPQPFPADASAECISGHCEVAWVAMPD